MVEWMGRNFDVFPGFQKIHAMRNIALYSVFSSAHEKVRLLKTKANAYLLE